MNLPISYFYNLIVAFEPQASILDEHAQPLTIQWIAATTANTVGRKGFLYFINSKISLEQKDKAPFGCVVHENMADAYAGIPRIVVPETCDLHQLMDYTITKVDRYRNWEDALHNTLMGNISLQSMLEVTYELIPRPMYIADPCWRMIARVDADMDKMSGIWHHQLQHGGYLPIETINALNDTGEYQLITNSTRAFNVKTKAFLIGFIAKTIKFRGRLLGYFFIVDLWHDLTPCDIEVADRFGNILATALGSRSSAILDVDDFHESALAAILDRDHIEEGMVSNLVATTMGWNLTGDYRLVVISHVSKTWDNAMSRMKAVGVITSGYDCYTEPYQNKTVIIFSNAELDPVDFRRHLNTCANKLRRPLFVSGRFTSFLELPDQFRNVCSVADSAEYATASNVAKVVESDRLFPRLLARTCSDLLPNCYEAQVLKNHDAQHGTEYAKSLYTFLLHERNYVTASEALYLHRNTLRNRIEKINELIQADLSDPQTRLRLIVSLNSILMAD